MLLKRFFKSKQNIFQGKLLRFQKIFPKSVVNATRTNPNLNYDVNGNSMKEDNFISNNANQKKIDQADNLLKEFLLKYDSNFLYHEDHDRDFLEFLEKIETLMKSEGRRDRRINTYLSNIKKLPISSREPAKEILQAYTIITNKISFDHKVLAETFVTLGKAYKSRDLNHRTYNDYNHHEMINSYRFKDIVEDLKYGLTYNYSFLNAPSLSRVIYGLGLCEYKDKEILNLILNKLDSLINKTPLNYEFKRPVDRPSYGKRDFYQKNLVADELFYDPKFQNHIAKLMNSRIARNEKSSPLLGLPNSSKKEELGKDIADAEYILGEIGELIQEIRGTQYKVTDSVNNLINQYFTIEQTLLKTPELINNQYIKYELYKLQDKLVQAGYINFETIYNISQNKLSDEEIKKMRFDNVLTVLRDFVALNYNYLFDEKFEKIASHFDAEKKYPLKENLYLIDSESLGKCLANLSDYCKINNSDVNREDYYNNVIEPNLIKQYDNIQIKDYGKIHHVEFNALKAEYTIYFNETLNFFKKIDQKVLEFVNNEPGNLKGSAHIYYAYSNMPLQAKDIKDAIVANTEAFLKEKLKINNIYDTKHNEVVINYLENNLKNEDKFNFIYGLAFSSYKPKGCAELARLVSNSINVNEDIHNTDYTLDEIIKVLWSMSYFKLYNVPCFIQILLKFHSRNIDNLILSRVDNNLFNQLKFCLKFEAVDFITIPKFTQEAISLNFNSNLDVNLFLKQPFSNMTAHDPLKEGLIDSIGNSINIKGNNKELQKAMTLFEAHGLLNSLPYKPDLIFGFYGQKIALFVLGKDSINVDDFQPNGYYDVVRRHLKEKFNTNSVFVPIHKALEIDLKSLDVKVNKQFNLDEYIAQSLNFDLHHNDLRKFSKYLNSLVKRLDSESEEISIVEEKNDLKHYFNSLLELIEKQNVIVYQYLPNLMRKYIDEIKLAIIKHNLIFDVMRTENKIRLNKIINDITNSNAEYKDFFNILLNKYEEVYKIVEDRIKKQEKSTFTESVKINNFWKGKRLNLDIATPERFNVQDKNLSVELLNNNHMWMVDYNPYADWEVELKKNYDNFNYYINNDQNKRNKYLFNNHPLGNRNVPTGIFPNPNYIRKIKVPLTEMKTNINSLNEVSTSYEDELMNYKNMHENLIRKEVLEKNKILPSRVSPEISLKVSLLNLRNSLKKNFSDNQILDFISKLNFVDKLISEHLNNLSNITKKIMLPNEKELTKRAKFLKRDSKSYLNFHYKLNNIVEKYDEYDKYLLKEIHKDDNLLEYEVGAEKLIIDENTGETLANKQVEEKVKENMEETEDNDAISIIPANKWEFIHDIKSIMYAFRLAENDPDLEDERLTSNPDLFLYEKRIKAERNMILTIIIYKAFNDKLITKNERKYIKVLQDLINSSDLLSFEKVGLTPHLTKLKISDLTSEDLNLINSLPNTNFMPDHKEYSLSELILELSHFIDNNTLNKFLLENFIQTHFQQVSEESRNIFENYNKEPKLINQEIKETIWRLSGTFNENDKETILRFFRVKRGKSSYDRCWLEIDEKSLNDFINDVNPNENRLLLLEKWLKRKEREYATRINLPAKHLRKSDKRIHIEYKKKEKNELVQLLCKLFNVKETKMITEKSISNFIDNFVEKLFLFEFNYPSTIIDIFNALQICENIKVEDKELLDTYRSFFKVEENSENYDLNEFLCVSPVKLEGESLLGIKNLEVEKELIRRMEKSHINFITPLVKKIKSFSLNL